MTTPVEWQKCMYYPCIKVNRLGVSQCIGCPRFIERNAGPSDEQQLED